MLDLANVDLTKTADRDMLVNFLTKLAEKISNHDLALVPEAFPLTGSVYGRAGTEYPISIVAAIAEKIYIRLERALYILESSDEGLGDDLTEVAAAIYEAQQTIRRLALAHQAILSNSPSCSED